MTVTPAATPAVFPFAVPETVGADTVAYLAQLRQDYRRIQLEYEFAIDEILTKVSILRREFMFLHQYNPIEHVDSRVKSMESLLEKTQRRGIALTPESIRAQITDIAGVRVTCSFISDTSRILDTLAAQADVEVVTVKDYIANPKSNGYQSLHAIVQVPVFLSSGPVTVPVEMQIRTIAMDFWASLEHKLHYKYRGAVPPALSAELAEAAQIASDLDRRMEHLHDEVARFDDAPGGPAAA